MPGTATIPATPPAATPTAPPPVRGWWIACAGIVVACLIVLGETDRLIQGVIDGQGRSGSLAGVLGPGALTEGARGTWEIWAAADLHALVGGWIWWHLPFDALVVVAAALLLLRFLAEDDGGRSVPVAVSFLFAWPVVELVEAGTLMVGAAMVRSGSVPDWFPWVVAVASTVKWAVVLGLVIAVLRRDALRARIVRAVRRAARAVFVQRLSVVVVLVVGALSLVPGGSVLDQLPDAQRGWLDDVGAGSAFVPDLWHLGWAVVSTVLVALALFLMGRQRSERAWTREVRRIVPGEQDGPHYVWWLVGPVGIAVLSAALRLSGREELVDSRTLAIFVAVPVTLVACSAVLGLRERRRARAGHPSTSAAVVWGAAQVLAGAAALAVALWHLALDGDGVTSWIVVGGVLVALLASWLRARDPAAIWAEQAPTDDEPVRGQRAVDIWRAGDMLALAVMVVCMLGLVRSFAAPALLPGEDGVRHAWQWALFLAGLVLVVVVPPFGTWTMGFLEGRFPRWLRPDHQGWIDGTGVAVAVLRAVVPVAPAVLAIAGLVALVRFPLEVSGALGVVATTVVALGSWTLVLGFLVVNLQRRRPLEVFRLLRMAANPVLTLLAAVLLTVTAAGGDPDLHRIRSHGDGIPASRPDVAATFAAWQARSDACDREVTVTVGSAEGRQVTVRPMLLVAASGGGIRAAVWTVGAMDRIADTGECGPLVTLLSSGVSGGSVGLALGRGRDPVAAADRLADPAGLSAGAVGALVGDLAAGITGVRLPPAGDTQWRDRAALMESVWEQHSDLAEPFGPDPAARPGLGDGRGGALILNSADARSNCRVLVSQVDLRGTSLGGPGAAPRPGQATSCRGSNEGLPAGSTDLLAIMSGCPGSLNWSTAAMLSGRFPFLTPAGRVGPTAACPALPDMQLIDGGYAEATGIATLADLAPDLMEWVRDHNAQVLAGAPGGLVVPFMLYLEDETRTDLQLDDPGLAPELFVPLVGRGAEALVGGSWTQRVADAIADPCPPPTPGADPTCESAVLALRSTVPDGIAIAAPVTVPAVDAPLGWTLSLDSRRRLGAALADQVDGCNTRTGVQGYPCLQPLLALLRGGALRRGDRVVTPARPGHS